MTKIVTRTDCGNSPKNALLQKFMVALAKADSQQLAKLVTEDVCWQPAGRKPVEGLGAFAKAITRYGPASRVVIDHVVSHGRAGAVDGTVEFGSKQRAFCHVFEFSNAKGTHISGITTYSIPLASHE